MNALAASEQGFFFELSPDLLAVISLDGYFKQINPAFTQTLGYSAAEFFPRRFLDFVHPDDQLTSQLELKQLNREPSTRCFKNRYQTQDGSYRWLAWTAFPQLQQGVIYCIARDITQEKQTEASHQELDAALEQENQALEQRIADRTAELERINGALRESEERHQLAMEVARMFSFSWDVSTDMVERSAHCGSILGLVGIEAEQDTGSNFFQRIHPEDRSQFVTLIQALAPDRNSYKTTYRVVRPDGQTIVLEESGRALFNSQGQLTRLIGMTADVTEQQRLETELKANQATLEQQLAEIETIYQSAPIGLNFLDTDLRFVRINQQLAEMNGFSIEAHIGKTVRELLPNLADTAEQLLRPILETGEPLLNVEIRGETPAQPGVQRIWLESFLPLKQGDTVIGINTVCEEITERKKTEATLYQLNLLIELSYEPLFVWSMDRGILTWNQGCENLYGYSRSEAIGQNSHTLLQTMYPLPLAEFLPMLERDCQWTGELRQTTQAGQQVIVESRQQIIDMNGQRLVLETNHDITERKQAEAQREQLLRQEQAARELAEHANRMKDEFLAVLSHELRTPLNPILGWAKLLQAPQVSPDRLQQGLTTIERNARQQVQLIEDLLDISRIIRGQLALNLAMIDVSQPILAALETVRLAAEAKSIRLEVRLEPVVGQIRGDGGRLQQVVWNLLSNSIKFTPSGGQVSLYLEQIEVGDGADGAPPPPYAQITVADTGKGIQPHFLPHVFELFRQQDSSSTRAFGGLGLGLAIARQIVEAHGGTITATSAGEGQGATFTVRLPLISAPNSQTTASQPWSSRNLANLRVLVVDDEADSLELVQVVLEQEHILVQAVSSAAAALLLLREHSFDLLISDIGMPDMDGYTLVRQLRTLPAQNNRDIPAIALTAYAGELNQRSVLAAGFQAHLAKPIDPQNLLDTIFALTT